MTQNTSVKEAIIINSMDYEAQAIDELISDLKALRASMNKVKRLSCRLSSNSDDLREEIKELYIKLNDRIKEELKDAEVARDEKHEELLSNISEEEQSKMQLELLLGFTSEM